MRIPLWRLLPLAVLGACAIEPTTAPPPGNEPDGDATQDADIRKLLAAPREIEIGGQRLTLEGIPWRDFMPGPPGDNGLIVVARVVQPDQNSIPAELEIQRVWVVKGVEVWSPSELEESRTPWGYWHEKVVRDGPLWPPRAIVHVIVELGDSSDRTWLLLDSEKIFTVW